MIFCSSAEQTQPVGLFGELIKSALVLSSAWLEAVPYPDANAHHVQSRLLVNLTSRNFETFAQIWPDWVNTHNTVTTVYKSKGGQGQTLHARSGYSDVLFSFTRAVQSVHVMRQRRPEPRLAIIWLIEMIPCLKGILGCLDRYL